MKFDTRTAASYAAKNIDNFLERATRDTQEIIARRRHPDHGHPFRCFPRHGEGSRREGRGTAEACRFSQLRDITHYDG